MTVDLAYLAEQDRRDVRALKRKHLGADAAPEPKDDDMAGMNLIVCDDYYKPSEPASAPTQVIGKTGLSTLAKVGIGAALAAGTGGIGLAALPWLMGAAAPAIVAPPSSVTNNNTEGFLIELQQGKPRE